MKTSVCIGVVSVLCAFSLVASESLADIDLPRVQELALNDITGRYVNIKPKELIFQEVVYSLTETDQAAALVTYTNAAGKEISTCLVNPKRSLVSIDKAQIEAIAVKTILSKRPELKQNNLVLESILYVYPNSGSDYINVVYSRTGASGKKIDSTIQTSTNGIITSTETINVEMSKSGIVGSISNGRVNEYNSSTR